MSEINNILILANKKILKNFSLEINNNINLYSIYDIENYKKLDFENYEQLAVDCKSLGIEKVIILDKVAIINNAVEIFNNYKIDVIAINKKFLQLQTSKLYAKNFMKKYSINYPKNLQLFLPIFPVIIKKNFYDKNFKPKIITNQKEKQKAFIEFGNDFFTEEFINGKELTIQTFFDGENLKIISQIKNLNIDIIEKIKKLLKKIEYGLINDNAKFKAYINIKFILEISDKLEKFYVLDYNFTDIELENSLLGLVQIINQ